MFGKVIPPHSQLPPATLAQAPVHKTNPKPELEGRGGRRGEGESWMVLKINKHNPVLKEASTSLRKADGAQ